MPTNSESSFENPRGYRLLCIAVAAAALGAMLSAAASAATLRPQPLQARPQAPWTQSVRLQQEELALVSEQDDGGAYLSEFETRAPRRWWPVLLSAALPGLGETVTGHRRGWFMIAADAGLWAGVKSQNDKGNDKEVEFEAFADAHWSQTRWEGFLNGNGSADGRSELHDYFTDVPPGASPEQVALYVSKEEDEREWYENLGKWDVFAWGWEEYELGWNPESNSLGGAPGNPVFNTPLRQQYVDLRGESNDAFRNRDRFFTAALLFRVVSMLQTAYLEGFIGGRYGKDSSQSRGTKAGLLLEPRGMTGARIGWKVSY